MQQYVYYNVILKIYNAYIHLATSMNCSKFQYTFYCRYCRQTTCLDNFQVPTPSVLTSLVSPEGQLLAASVADFPHPGMPLDLVCMGNTVYVMYILLCHLYYSYIRLIQRYDILGSILTCSWLGDTKQATCSKIVMQQSREVLRLQLNIYIFHIYMYIYIILYII